MRATLSGATARLSDATTRLASRLDGLRTRVADSLRERRADRAFRGRSFPAATPADDAPRHVVCVVVDALRADAVDASVTPFLDSLSPAPAVSPSTWTFPSVTSLLTGEYPHRHGAIRRTDAYETAVADVTPLPPSLDASATALPGRLAGAGYDTYGGFGMIVPFLALSGRFATHRLVEGASAERLLSGHAAWLADRRDDRTFSYLHLGDLHEPVDPPADYWDAHGVDRSVPDVRRWRHEDVPHLSPTVERYRTHRRRLYRAAADYVDDRLAAHHARLADRLDDVLVVVAGDHGEGFWERAAFHADRFADPRPAYCVGHGGAPYEVVTRVPLGVSGADVDPDGRVSLVDVAPTVLDAVGLDGPTTTGGQTTTDGPTTADGPTTTSDPPAVDGPPRAGISLLDGVPDRRLLVEGVRYGYEKKAVYADDWKLVVSRGDDVAAGFSLPDGTVRDIPEPVEASMREALPAWPGGERRDPPSAAVQRRLEELGYA